MTEKIFAHIIAKILQLLLGNRHFFGLKKEEKLALLKETSIPPSFHDYLSEVSEGEFVPHLALTLKAIKSVGDHSGKMLMKNGLGDAFSHYLLTEVGGLLDRIPLMFFSLSTQQKRDFLEKKTKWPPVFVDALSTMTYQEIFEDLHGFLAFYLVSAPFVVIQAARDPESGIKQDIRQKLSLRNHYAFPLFQVSDHLAGGMRIFVDGVVTDNSWIGKIERFISATNG